MCQDRTRSWVANRVLREQLIEPPPAPVEFQQQEHYKMSEHSKTLIYSGVAAVGAHGSFPIGPGLFMSCGYRQALCPPMFYQLSLLEPTRR